MLRSQGVLVQGAWLNKTILMFKETINSSKAKSKHETSPLKEVESRLNQSDDDSIFNIQFNDIPGQSSVKDLLNTSY